MKQKKLRTDVLFLIIFTVWAIAAGLLYFLVAKNEKTDAEKVLMILKILIGLIYFPVPLFPIILFFLHRHCKATGDGKPLSVAAMRESKKHIPKKIYKFCSLTSKGGNESLNKSKLETLANDEIWLSKCLDLNDPFEGQMFMLPEEDYIQNGVPEEMKHRCGVENIEELIDILSSNRKKYCQTSFSKTFRDINMWGYYANGCRGYCVEYEVFDKEMLFPVFCVHRRIIVSGIFKSKLREKLLNRKLKQINKSLYKISDKEYSQYILYLQSFKYTQWAFEKEIRAIDLTMPNYQGGNQPAINYGLKPTKIIVGYLCEYLDELKRIALQLNIPFSIMKPNFETAKFKLIEQKIS